MKKALLLLVLILIPQILTSQITSQSANIIIYRDGVVHVKIFIELSEDLYYIKLPLLSRNVSNVVVYDENRELLNYEINDDEIEIYSLESKLITLEYDTNALTFKSKELWTFKLDAPFEIEVTFPDGAVIMGISAIPKQIAIENGKVKMVLNPGYYEIDYIIPISYTEPMSINPLIFTIVVIPAMICILLLRRRKVGEKIEGGDEEKILNFIRKNKGRALEAEIRAAFPEIPRTTLWRMLKRLEKRGIIKIKKVGLQNLVELT
ncbi:MAG: hypothetical protein NZ922_01175 [Candidatus Methanomethyliaceae archaeon]|nr:hypothetical protein [Candidatus Methanomethyliaceae archaeon]MDW7971456.1 hypothetical protein [Nitrososphaerota archaeon]